METEDGKKVGNYAAPRLVVLAGGKAGTRQTHAERELELALRELVYAMDGKGKNLRNVARGATHPARMLVRRFKEAKRARKDRVNYPLCKDAVRALDRYVDLLFGKTWPSDVFTTGDFPKAA